MWRLILAFIDVAFHKRGPDEMPASQFLFSLVIASFLATGLFSLSLSDPAERFLELNILGIRLYLGFVGLIVLELFFDIIFIWGVLKAFGHSHRFLQTATALFGAQTMVGLTRIPILVWIDASRNLGNNSMIGVFIYLALFIWTMDIAAFILAKASEKTYFVGTLIVVGYVMMSFAIRDYMFPLTG
ncbi:MAG: hypothetical protein CMM56_01720 [Rhodospirillaceae bacterium]|nr:hypothetical protein [Rhodospirillaceae bacterium]